MDICNDPAFKDIALQAAQPLSSYLLLFEGLRADYFVIGGMSAFVSETRVRDCEGLLGRQRIQIQSVCVDVQQVGLRLAGSALVVKIS